MSEDEDYEKAEKPKPKPIICLIGDKSIDELIETKPQQQEFTFNDITFSSKFDSGNMSRAEVESSENGALIVTSLFNLIV